MSIDREPSREQRMEVQQILVTLASIFKELHGLPLILDVWSLVSNCC